MSARVIPLNAPSAPALTPREAYIAGLAPGSRAGQSSALRTIAAILGREADERLSYADAVRVRGALLESSSPAYARKVLCALRGVARAARELGLGDAESLRAVEATKGVKGGDAKAAGRDIRADEQAAIMAACDDGTVCGVRDAAALALLLYAGLRRAEACALRAEDVTLIETGGELRVSGKGGKIRRVPVVPQLAARLAAYAAIRGDSTGPLICAVTRGDRLTSDGIGGDALYQILRRRCELAGVTEVRPHDARRTVATSLLNRGADIGTVADWLGHASIDTTRRYDMSREARVRQAAQLLAGGEATREARAVAPRASREPTNAEREAAVAVLARLGYGVQADGANGATTEG